MHFDFPWRVRRFAVGFGLLLGMAVTAAVPVIVGAQGAVPLSQPVGGMRLELRRTDAQQAELEALLEAQRTPGSPDYRKWLTPEQFAARFAPDAQVRGEAQAWLQRHGFEVTLVARNGMRIGFKGTAAQVAASFELKLFSTADGSGRVRASAGAAPVATSAAMEVRALRFTDSPTDGAAALAAAVDSNTQAAVLVDMAGQGCTTEDADVAADWKELLEEATAEGITVLEARPGATDNAAGSAAVLARSAAARSDADRDVAASVAVAARATSEFRPEWQSADGLPADGLRAVPDGVLPDAESLLRGLNDLAATHGRVGALAPQMYRLAVGHGIFHHSDATVPEGTWTVADGLGTVDVKALLQALATGTTGVNVALEASSTTITHGQSLGLTYTVTGSGGVPSGTVTATLKGRSGSAVTLGPATLNSSGVATLSATTLAGDVYDIAGTYSGDSTFAAGTSNTVTSTVNPEDVALSATASPAMVGGTIPVTVTARSQSGVGVPSGPVTVLAYFSATPTTVTGTLGSSSTSSASALVKVPATATGKITLQATCTSNGSFACNQPVSFAATVTSAAPIVTLTSMPEAAVANSATQKYDLTVTVAAPGGSTAATPTGAVTLENNGTAVATLTLSSGVAKYTASLSGTGNSLVASYGGDANYAPADSAAVVVNAPLIGTATALKASPTAVSFGSATALTATVTPSAYAASGAPTGTVTFTSSLQGVVGTATLASGFVTYNTGALQVGSHTITATYAGDANYATSVSSPVSITVTAAKLPTIAMLSLSPAQPLAGQNTSITAVVAPNFASLAGATPPNVTCTGQVTFFSNNTFVANGLLSAGTVTVTGKLPSGSDSLTAVYAGDAQCYGSTSTAVVVSPAKVGSATTVVTSASYANAGRTIQVTATVATADSTLIGIPSGTVTFYDTHGGVQVQVGTATLATSGTAATATVNVNGSTDGQHSFTAVYGGDAVFLPSTSGGVQVNFGDFAVLFTPASLSLAQGTSGSMSAAVTVSSGFNSPVTLLCTPPGGTQMSCGFSPATVAGGDTAVLTVTTTGQTAAVRTLPSRGAEGGAGATIVAILLLPFRRMRRLAALMLLTVCVALGASGCGLGTVDPTNNYNGGGSSGGNGGGSASSGTPLGTQFLSVTAASADGSLRHTYSIAVTVQ